MDSYTLKSVSDLPAPFRSIFSFRYFNSLQSECFPICFHSDVNMVISAPTGSGKTVLFELCILRLLSRFFSEDGRFVHTKGTLKTIYIAPSKALVQEKLRDWNQKFGSLGTNCLELTGDNESYNIRNIQEADIILTTPEKFDAVTRFRIKDGGLSFFSDIALLLIDEVHLLNDPRGAALEAIVSRIKMVSCNPEMKLCPLASIRFLAVSATIPNVEDLAEWLKVPFQGIKRFGEEMRPVKLATKVFGYAPAKNDFLFEKRLQNYIFDILMQYSRGKSALIFCSTRKGAQEAAQRLSQIVMTFGHSNPFIKNKEQQDRLREASLSCSDKQMQSYILYGVGYHNGGLCLKDRNLIEGLFLKGDIQVLCTTNTLAHGINLPAHTVVIKSTQHFNKEKGLYMEYDRSTVLQMSGRAGRPPFDDTGMVIIMTRRETVHLYENLLNGCEMVESQLLSCVTEHLTAEIVQLTVSDVTRAIEWMKCSYLYIRMKRNPENYAIRKGISGSFIEKHVQEICVQKVNELSQHQMVWIDEDGFLLRPLEPGRLMTKYYLKFNTMKYIMQTPANCSLEDAIHVVCRAEEIAWIQLRRNEKKLLNDINADKDARLRYHILGDKGKRKKRIQTREEKIFILVNDCLTGDPSVHDLSLIQDMNSTCTNGCRIARCMKDYFIYKKNYKGSLNSALLAKSLNQKLWDDSPYLLKQLPGIGMVTAKALYSMGIKSFETLSEADPRRIEIVTGRKYPFGNHIKDSLQLLPPKVDLKVMAIEGQRQGKSKLVVTLTRLSESTQSVKRHYADMIVGSEEDNIILFHEKIRVEEFSSPYSATILLSIPQQGNLTVKADVIFEEYIGIDLHQKLLLMKENTSNLNRKRNGKQPSFFPPLEELYVIEDGDETPSQVPAKEPDNLSKSKDEDVSIPSFNLLGEELGEGEPVLKIEKEDDCKIITEKTVFDHIRQKAKTFPLLPASDNVHSPSAEVLCLTRKRSRENRRELHDVEILEEKNVLKFPRHSVVNPLVEFVGAEQNGHDIYQYLTLKDHDTSRSSNDIDLLADGGVFPPEPEEGSYQTKIEETIFYHIQRKAKNFPVINKFDSMGPFIQEKKFSQNNSESLAAAFDVSKQTYSSAIVRDTIVIPDPETSEPEKDSHGIKDSKKVRHYKFEGSSGIQGVPNLPQQNSSSNADLSSIRIDVPMLKNKLSSEPGSCMRSSKNQHFSGRESKEELSSPSEIRRQCWSLETASKTKEVESYLGFKSVFSFL
ncbi:DExH-box ATP-dependent RNA helicase [Quillaja saponaria]|uniref:DNA 3'-5' helicase n=1 Tax=Quillaja saponaria TaxID=32244 RepID=A0AAD7M6P0_QUISA|nr:DExH-box ATP-dependent RNA helicase [Quillaja saponaria]